MNTLFFAATLASLLTNVGASGSEFQILPSNSDILFRVRHMGISSVTGRFGVFSGSFRLDPEDIAATKGSAVIKTASINTNDAKRDRHLAGEDFFNAEKFPEITFVSTSVRAVNRSDSTCELVGRLTIRDITKEIVLKVKGNGLISEDGRGNSRAGFSASGKINRFDFGLKWNKVIETGALVADTQVELILSFEASRPNRAPAAATPGSSKVQ